MNKLLLFDISHRVSGGWCAGCAVARPIFCSFINRGLSFEQKNLDFFANLHTQFFKASTDPGTNTAIYCLKHFTQVQFWIILTDFSMYNQTQLKNVSIYFVIFVFCIFSALFSLSHSLTHELVKFSGRGLSTPIPFQLLCTTPKSVY